MNSVDCENADRQYNNGFKAKLKKNKVFVAPFLPQQMELKLQDLRL
jgi:hypothetical protein